MKSILKISFAIMLSSWCLLVSCNKDTDEPIEPDVPFVPDHAQISLADLYGKWYLHSDGKLQAYIEFSNAGIMSKYVRDLNDGAVQGKEGWTDKVAWNKESEESFKFDAVDGILKVGNKKFCVIRCDDEQLGLYDYDKWPVKGYYATEDVDTYLRAIDIYPAIKKFKVYTVDIGVMTDNQRIYNRSNALYARAANNEFSWETTFHYIQLDDESETAYWYDPENNLYAEHNTMNVTNNHIDCDHFYAHNHIYVTNFTIPGHWSGTADGYLTYKTRISIEGITVGPVNWYMTNLCTCDLDFSSTDYKNTFMTLYNGDEDSEEHYYSIGALLKNAEIIEVVTPEAVQPQSINTYCSHYNSGGGNSGGGNSGGSGGGSGSGNDTDGWTITSTKVAKIWVSTMGMNTSSSMSAESMYKWEKGSKVVLSTSKTSSSGSFWKVASRNTDSRQGDYNVSSYKYVVHDYSPVGGNWHYYFN